MTKNIDLIDDLSDLNEGSDLYENCENKKLNGASNAELREYLREHKIPEDQIKEIVRQIDSDFMSGKISKAPSKTENVVSIVIGTILIVVGLGLIFFQLIIGVISGLVLVIAISILSTGIGLVTLRHLRQKKGRR